MTDLKTTVIAHARACGFDLVGVTGADDFAVDREAALDRIRDGRMDGLPWYTESRVVRGTSPEELLPGARSVICLGLSYFVDSSDGGWNESETPGAGMGRVARYAWVRDYHRVMKRRMREFVRSLEAEMASVVSARWYVDDGPMLDRAAANRAGIGWFGKNTNILTPSLGSWVFLGQVITDLALEPDAPLKKTCGSCSRCIDDCPTGAIVAPYVVDNSRCISYLTIENRGSIPTELRPLMGDWVFGCDICQDVCPVNRKAGEAERPIPPRLNGGPGDGPGDEGSRDGLSTLDLVALLEMSEEAFRSRFAGTSIMRAKRAGMQRNACVALGNVGDQGNVPALARALLEADPLVRGHAAWALGRIGGQQAQSALNEASAVEIDPEVKEEIAEAQRAIAGAPAFSGVSRHPVAAQGSGVLRNGGAAAGSGKGSRGAADIPCPGAASSSPLR